ncbi:CHAT domain-containing protein [Shivajiella indica]|uniref:CHAT domain-containing protein n=1 Tax=Shivajiella indica TaxID=872115 RepID=A0ABW5B9P8_9BACT
MLPAYNNLGNITTSSNLSKLINRWFLLFLLLFYQHSPGQGPEALLSKYSEALAYYESENPSDYTDSMSMVLFKELLHSGAELLEDKIKLDIFEKCGNLALIKGDLKNAVVYYRNGLEIQNSDSVNDTLFFASNLFLGEAYYLKSQADSSIFYLEEAEKLIQQKSSLTEASRLYNSLGVIYFESGNYVQSVTYFTKAKNLIIGNRSFDELEPYFQYALFSFLSNIGSSLIQLNRLDSALAIYHELERYGFNRDQVYTQMTGIFLDKSLPDSALNYLEKITSEEFKESPSFQNQRAEIFLQRHELARAKDVLQSYLSRTRVERTGSSNFRLGRSYNLLGKIAFEEGDYESAVKYFHQAMINIDGYFDSPDIFKNPMDYSLGFATFSLIESLVDKAKSFVKLYESKQDPKFFQAGRETFQTAFDMAFFVSNYYDNDEARIFLGDFVLETYQYAIETVLERYELDRDIEYLTQALEWAERSKATGLNIGIRERKLKKISGISTEKLQLERDLHFSISRIQQAILLESNVDQVALLQDSLTDKRLELSRLHNEFNNSPDYVMGKLNYLPLDIPFLQKELLDRKTIILSFFETESNFILFLLDKENIDLQVIEKSDILNHEIQNLRKNIIGYKLGQKYNSGAEGMTLFNHLFGKAYSRFEDYPNILIIPHGNLIDLPFEVLESKNGQFLLYDHAITYQYSLQLIGKIDLKSIEKAKNIGFAPFFDHSWSDEQVQLSSLPYSGEEITYLKGTGFVGEEAGKDVFLDILPEAEYLQLSTHAIPDPQNPDLAFIALFPGNIESRLYTNEVVNMDLSHTSLVLLSACETNFGALSRSEGALSISRAFMLAGCQNIISSLWKAEDKATAYITEAFYRHVEKGNSFSVSLRKAKMELLADPAMAQYHHPVFWANLVLVGNLNKTKLFIPIYLYLFLGLVPLAGYWIYHSRQRRRQQKI